MGKCTEPVKLSVCHTLSYVLHLLQNYWMSSLQTCHKCYSRDNKYILGIINIRLQRWPSWYLIGKSIFCFFSAKLYCFWNVRLDPEEMLLLFILFEIHHRRPCLWLAAKFSTIPPKPHCMKSENLPKMFHCWFFGSVVTFSRAFEIQYGHLTFYLLGHVRLF